MYKALCLIALLVGTIALTGRNLAATSAAPAPTWKIVQVLHLAHQSADIPSTTIFTPTTGVLYRLTVNIDCSPQRGDGGDWTYSVSWTEEGPGVRGSAGESNSSGQVVPFRGRAGTPVVYSVTGAAQTFTYDLDIVIEQLK